MTIPIASLVGDALRLTNTLLGTDKAVVLERTTVGAYDPIAGRPANPVVTTETLTHCTVVPFNPQSTNVFVDASLLREESYRVIVAALTTLIPQAGDDVTIDGLRYVVIGVGKPAGVYNLVVTR